ncbi:phosphate ABC transporter substrate-binding protein PstS [Niveibacterium umoris]|uniref:Phosphate-binding protein PstS n=1 Tax=Niveibacterium umoris TaxID=1193620 RepID=A0A840BJ86_9RHOO|nr:phosphate ABC transporter substrate-binding protein PstS [Niveibacterium umoris]MBB4010976.1 phosphate transport system substrate-binding protein [Niveibacterium umoris]
MFKRIAIAVSVSLLSVGAASAAEVTGAGASFPAPVYSKWADAYQKATGNKVNYQSIGSSGGLKQIKAKTVDFGASDAPVKPEELQKEGLVQFPTVIGGVVPVVNIPGFKPGQLKMTGPVLADIYLGKIKKWNDPAIAKLNPGAALPDQAVAVVRRADGSGTSFIFTNYLAKVSQEWKDKVGEGTAVQWPTGTGGKGNEGVSAFVQQLPGSIGYVEFAYAKQNKLTHLSMQNADGAFVQPDDLTFKAAAAGADWSKSAFYQILTNQPGKESWPITGATFIVMQATADKPAQSAEALKFFEWAYKNGSAMASDLDYVPLPDGLIKLIHASWNNIKDASGKPVFQVK